MKEQTSREKAASEKDGRVCAYCGFGISGILEKAHIDGNKNNNAQENIVFLCLTCHRLYDTRMIQRKIIRNIRLRSKSPEWPKLDERGDKRVAETKGRVCSYCRFGISSILKKAYIDRNSRNKVPGNICFLCPTCYEMYVKGMITSETIEALMNARTTPDWSEVFHGAERTKKLKTTANKAANSRRRKPYSHK